MNGPAVETLIVCVVAAVDQTFPLACEEDKSTEQPEQKVVGPLALIVGTDGVALTVTRIGAEDDEHPLPFVYVTEYEPVAVTLIEDVVEDSDQTFPLP